MTKELRGTQATEKKEGGEMTRVRESIETENQNSYHGEGVEKGGEMTTITIEARIPTNPEYYGPEVSDEEAEVLANGVKEIYEAILPRGFPNAEISVCLVPETYSFGNQTRVYAEGVEDAGTELEILTAVERDVERVEETIWSNLCRNDWQVHLTIDSLLAQYT